MNGVFFKSVVVLVLFKYAVSTASVLYDFFFLFLFFVALRVATCFYSSFSRHSFTFMLRYHLLTFFSVEYFACSFVHLLHTTTSTSIYPSCICILRVFPVKAHMMTSAASKERGA